MIYKSLFFLIFIFFFRLTVKELQENDMIDEIEFQKFLEENNVALKDNAVGLAEWVNDRKLVFQSDIPIEFVFLFKKFEM